VRAEATDWDICKKNPHNGTVSKIYNKFLKLNQKINRTGGVAQAVKCLFIKCEALSLNLRTRKKKKR
jgi:hypothetical protein